jgi:hypothetical protein
VISFILLLAIPISSAYAESVFTVGSTQYIDDQQTVQMDVTPYIEDGRTFLPIRYVANALGVSDSGILYDPKTQEIDLFKGSSCVRLLIGNTTMYVAASQGSEINNATITMDVAPEIVNGRAYLPVAWLAKAFDANVSWDDAAQTITIGDTSSSGETSPVPQTITIPAMAFPSNVSVIPNTFTWQYEGQQFSWEIDTPTSLMELEGFYQIPNLQQLLDNYARIWSLLSNDPSQVSTALIQQAINTMITDKASSLYVEYLAKDLDQIAKQQGYDRFHEAEFIASFVQNVKYAIVSYNMEYPPQTIANGGDCINKSIVLAAILSQLGYQTCVFMYPKAGHAMTGMVFNDSDFPSGISYSPTCALINGQKYFVTETTATGWGIGQWSLTQEGYSTDKYN